MQGPYDDAGSWVAASQIRVDAGRFAELGMMAQSAAARPPRAADRPRGVWTSALHRDILTGDEGRTVQNTGAATLEPT